MPMKALIDNFERFFEIVPVNTEALLHEVHCLRYEVFCHEKGFFDVYNPRHEEADEYDQRSVHTLLRHRASGQFAATVRLILPDPVNPGFTYPLEEHILDLNAEEARYLASIPRHKLAEISRFSVARAFRRRTGEDHIEHGINRRFGDEQHFKGRRFDSYITLGLFKAIFSMAKAHDIEYLCAFMEPSLIRLLQRVGIRFRPIGRQVNYYGDRRTCYENIQNVLEGIRETRPQIWEFITDQQLLLCEPCD